MLAGAGHAALPRCHPPMAQSHTLAPDKKLPRLWDFPIQQEFSPKVSTWPSIMLF